MVVRGESMIYANQEELDAGDWEIKAEVKPRGEMRNEAIESLARSFKAVTS